MECYHHSRKISPLLPSQYPPPPTNLQRQLLFWFFHHSLVLLILELYINGIMHCGLFVFDLFPTTWCFEGSSMMLCIIPFFCWVAFHDITPSLTYQLFAIMIWSCYGYPCTHFFVNICFYFSWINRVEFLDHRAGACLSFKRNRWTFSQSGGTLLHSHQQEFHLLYNITNIWCKKNFWWVYHSSSLWFQFAFHFDK